MDIKKLIQMEISKQIEENTLSTIGGSEGETSHEYKKKMKTTEEKAIDEIVKKIMKKFKKDWLWNTRMKKMLNIL
jgi:hypothetical protein